MHIPSLIARKRDGETLSDEEIRKLISGFTTGEIPDYQVASLAMAIFFRGMNSDETASLTQAMLESGEVFSYPDSHPLIVGKHSTGGIGDKTSLILAPLLACDDLWIPKISGRGLGITGGTLDKLSAIPGFRVDLGKKEALAQLERIGVVMMGQTADLCPADKKLYALRDVTGTVPSIPLIVASIMSKKLAESLDRLVLDVKYGSGAFMKTEAEANKLAEGMRSVGEEMGIRVITQLNPMNEPLGHTVGNALEVQEAIETLRGNGPADLVEVTLDLASAVSLASRETLATWLENGKAWEKFVSLVEAQGGNPAYLESFESVHPAEVIRPVEVEKSGMILSIDAAVVGQCTLELGAGRTKSTDGVDFGVGFSHLAKVGQAVCPGDAVARIHARTEEAANRAEAQFRKGLTIG